MNIIKGIPVAPGVVIGRVFVLDQVRTRVPYHVVAEEDVARELSLLDAALDHARTELSADRDRAEKDLGSEPAKIFAFHLGLLHDPTLVDPVRERIESERVTAAYAVAEAFRTLADRFREMGSEIFRQKANDVLDLDRRLLGYLVGQSEDRLANLNEPVIVVAHELTPAQAASLDTSRVIGFATDAGGRTSHTSIVAAALDIPVVVGCKDVTRFVNDGDEII
ncbi:MAG: phosphoenolpyruvate-utilizing N-terminal domain-containing protein, partial [Planctomycetota bacterium]